MKYSYDKYGWYSSEEIADRQTEVSPPESGEPVVGEPYPNFTGYEWIMLPYNANRNIALIKNGKVENIIVADLEFANQLGYDEIIDTEVTPLGIGWSKVNGEWIAPAPSVFSDPTVTYKSILTPLEFLRRFTQSEWEAIETACESSSVMRFWMKKYDKAQDVDLNDLDTIEGVQSLELFGIISIGRATEILTKYPI